MKRLHFIAAVLSFICLSLIPQSFTKFETAEDVFQFKEYLLGPTSVLEINGKTNINSFCCTSRERFPKGEIIYQLEEGTATFYFKKTNLKINVRELDCGAKPINKDLQETLHADEYPFITISLKQAYNLDCNRAIDCEKWVDFEALADITLACVTKRVTIPVNIKKAEDHRFRITGATTLYFKDFNLDPPSAMLGLIKVKESIDIKFDLDAILL